MVSFFGPYFESLVEELQGFSSWFLDRKLSVGNIEILLMEEILHELIDSLSHYLQGFYTSQVVQDFFLQQYNYRSCFHKWLDSTIMKDSVVGKFVEKQSPDFACFSITLFLLCWFKNCSCIQYVFPKPL